MSRRRKRRIRLGATPDQHAGRVPGLANVVIGLADHVRRAAARNDCSAAIADYGRAKRFLGMMVAHIEASGAPPPTLARNTVRALDDAEGAMLDACTSRR